MRQKSQIFANLTSKIQIMGKVARLTNVHSVSLMRHIPPLTKIRENATDPPALFAEIDRMALKHIQNCRGLRVSKTKLKKQQLENSHFLISRLNAKRQESKLWYEGKQISETVEGPERNPCICGQFASDSEAGSTQWGKSSLQQVVLGQLTAHGRVDLNAYLTPHAGPPQNGAQT